MMGPLFIVFLAAMIVLGGMRLWSMMKIAGMLSEPQRAEILPRLAKPDGTENWENLIGPGATRLVQINRTATRLGLFATGGFAIVLIASMLMK